MMLQQKLKVESWGEDITNTWIALTEFVCTYECLLALLSNIEDQIQMHQSIRKARDYLETLEADNAVLTH